MVGLRVIMDNGGVDGAVGAEAQILGHSDTRISLHVLDLRKQKLALRRSGDEELALLIVSLVCSRSVGLSLPVLVLVRRRRELLLSSELRHLLRISYFDHRVSNLFLALFGRHVPAIVSGVFAGYVALPVESGPYPENLVVEHTEPCRNSGLEQT